MLNFFCLEMDAKVMNTIIEKVALEWKRLVSGTGFNEDIRAIIDHIDHDVTGEESKIKSFLKKLYQYHPKDYKTFIEKAYNNMQRSDVPQDISLMGIIWFFIITSFFRI